MDKNDALLCAICHASVVLTVFSFTGIIVSLFIWIMRGEKSEYVDFQAKQALAYQFLVVCANIALGILVFAVSIATFGLGVFAVVPLLLLLDFAAIVYGFYAAYKCFEGEDFKYFWIGDWINSL